MLCKQEIAFGPMTIARRREWGQRKTTKNKDKTTSNKVLKNMAVLLDKEIRSMISIFNSLLTSTTKSPMPTPRLLRLMKRHNGTCGWWTICLVSDTNFVRKRRDLMHTGSIQKPKIFNYNQRFKESR